MSVSPRLAQALQQALGVEASKELMAIFESRDSEYVDLRSEISVLRADMAELRHEMHVGFEKLRADVAERVEQRFSDLLKWSFVFWAGAVTTLTLMLRSFR